MTTGWHGVFPAATTQFHEDFSVDIDATQRVLDALVNDGVIETAISEASVVWSCVCAVMTSERAATPALY